MIASLSQILFPLARKFGLGAAGVNGGRPPFMGAVAPLPAGSVSITGVSRDSTGAPLGGCTVTLFRVDTKGASTVFTQTAVTVSDGSGNYSFIVGTEGPWRVTWDLDGVPIRAGISLKTLAGV